jgi:hypothetical protein
MAQVILHQRAAHRSQSFLCGRNLHEYICAISILFHQALQTAHLSFNPAQTLQVRRFDFRIDRQRFPAFLMSAATARCRMPKDWLISR